MLWRIRPINGMFLTRMGWFLLPETMGCLESLLPGLRLAWCRHFGAYQRIPRPERPVSAVSRLQSFSCNSMIDDVCLRAESDRRRLTVCLPSNGGHKHPCRPVLLVIGFGLERGISRAILHENVSPDEWIGITCGCTQGLVALVWFSPYRGVRPLDSDSADEAVRFRFCHDTLPVGIPQDKVHAMAGSLHSVQ